MTTFNCTKCGACCKLIPDVVLLSLDLPIAPSGGCGHLTENNECAIYDTRPEVCSVERTYVKKHEPLGVTREEYFKRTEEVCRVLEKLLDNKEKEE